MNGLSDALQEFQRRMAAHAQAGPAASAELLLDVMEPDAARLLKLAAIPQQFDAEILRVLAPEVAPAEIQRHCDEFAQLSFLQTGAEGWALHDAVRRHLFRQWLQPARRETFAQASARLARHFERRADASAGETSETARRRHMFHLIGADQEAGFREFERLLRRARHRLLYSECSQLIGLVHEYDDVLAPRHALWLQYHEAKLAADLRNPDQAETAFEQLLRHSDLPADLRSATYVRLGYVHAGQRRWDDAIVCYEQALALAQTNEAGRPFVPRILQDLGAAYRDKGELERAEDLLEQAVHMAQAQDNLAALGLACNSLGVLALRRREVRAAIEAFEKCLAALQRNDDWLRTASVYNNLGLAYADLPDWVRSAEYFGKSLEIKARAGDTLGQAWALNNLARVQAIQGDVGGAIDSATRAITLFGEMRDRYDAAVARHNRGKLYHRMQDDVRAREDYAGALETFRSLHKLAEAEAVARDLSGLDVRVGLPWWAWASIVLFALVVLLLLALAFEDA